MCPLLDEIHIILLVDLILTGFQDFPINQLASLELDKRAQGYLALIF